MSKLLTLASVRDYDEDVLKRNTRNIMALFAHWQLKNDEECHLLGGVSSAQLAKLRKGTACISGRDTIERVGNLLGIHKNLRILYPYNRTIVYQWIKAKNRKLHNMSPLDLMLEQGYLGIAQVRRFTDYLRGQ